MRHALALPWPHSEIFAARAEVQKAEAVVRLAKTDMWVPDVEAFARYSYQENVPFLSRNFGPLVFISAMTCSTRAARRP